MTIHRRFISLAFPFLALALPASAAAQTEMAQGERPNVLFIITDDLSDAIEPLDSVPTSATPAMTRLSRMGVTFTNAHANSPVCAPSRNSMFSGYHPRTTGAYNFRQWRESTFLSGTISMFRHFREAGYTTMGTGKIHHHTGAHRDDWSMIDGERQYESNFDAGPWPWNGDPDNGRTIHPSMAFLLDHVDGLSSERRMRGSSSRSLSFGRLSDVPSYAPENGLPGYTGWRYQNGNPFRYVSADDRDLMPDEKKTQFALRALQRDYDAPFMLAVGFNRPHEPLYVPDEYFDRFPLDSIELPPILASDWDDLGMIPDTSRGYAFRPLHNVCSRWR